MSGYECRFCRVQVSVSYLVEHLFAKHSGRIYSLVHYHPSKDVDIEYFICKFCKDKINQAWLGRHILNNHFDKVYWTCPVSPKDETRQTYFTGDSLEFK